MKEACGPDRVASRSIDEVASRSIDGRAVCSRFGCTNGECTHHSEKYGYICDECLDELVGLCKKSGVVTSQVIERFLEAPRKKLSPDEYDIIEEFVRRQFAPIEECDVGIVWIK